MYFKQILNEQCGCASDVIASRKTRDAAVVDAASDTEPYTALLREREFRLRYVIDTHIHADHVSGARRLAASHGAELCLHESARTAYPFHALRDGYELELGQLRLRVLHTPGHRPELISLLIVNPPRSPEPSMVLTADSLLVGDVGRPDFGGGDAAAQFDSLNRLFRLPDWVAVFPGHFEGPCGKAMCGRPSTTIGFERLYNPLARLDRGQFVARLGQGHAAAAAQHDGHRGDQPRPRRHGMGDAHVHRPVCEVDQNELEARPPEVVLLDVREPHEFAGGHVPGARNLPQADLATRLSEVPRDRPLYLICQGGFRSLRAAQFLSQMGFKDVASVSGGTEGWRAAQKSLALGDTASEPERFIESEWAHAGGVSYEI